MKKKSNSKNKGIPINEKKIKIKGKKKLAKSTEQQT